MNAPQDFRSMTADTVGKDLLSALVAELRLLPEPWQKLSQKKQDDIIDRLRNRVETNVKMAVHLMAAHGRTVVAGDLDQITIKDGVKAVVKFSPAAPSLHQLYEAAGKAVLVVVAGPEDHTGGMDEVKGEADQRAMDLGHEYHDNDGGGMEGNGSDDVVDAEFVSLPAPGDVAPSEEELEQAHTDGYEAAADGIAKEDCPVMRGELCIEWIKGWQEWTDLNVDEVDTKFVPRAPVKYRDPNNTSRTWSGRGRQPTWVVEWIKNGGTMEQLESSSDEGRAA